MKRMRIMGLCLVAAFALSAIGAVSASALPEVGRCVEKVSSTSKYTDANCTKKAVKGNGTHEFLKGAKSETEGVHFTSAGGEGVLETEAGTKVVCQTQTATGKYDQDTGAIKEVESVVARFNTCAIPALGIACNSKGAAPEEIVTSSLHGPMGYIKKLAKSVGQELTPDVKKGAFAEFECGGGAAKVVVKEGTHGGHNCVIAPVTPVNVMSTTAEQVYSGAAGKQSPQNFEGKTVCNLESGLNGGAAEPATQSLTTTVTNEEALEIKA
jgi:hypothetical protein